MHMSLDDILSIGNLMEHASFHKKAYGDDLMSFLAKHYGSEQSDHMDNSHNDEHQDLPFQHSFVHAFCPIALVSSIEFEFYIPEAIRIKQNPSYTPLQIDLFASGMFQPPRWA